MHAYIHVSKEKYYEIFKDSFCFWGWAKCVLITSSSLLLLCMFVCLFLSYGCGPLFSIFGWEGERKRREGEGERGERERERREREGERE
jgi:hypothetical protein